MQWGATVQRPELASAWQPFYSSSPSFSAHSSASMLSLQGSAPLPGHPKTLRDLTHASELLTLPAAFGAIQLGETFSSCLCVNNEALSEVEVKQIKVEMQTATSKVTLSELDENRQSRMLAMGDSMETVVHHEIKELGQHVLACAVTYRLPATARPVPGAAEDANDPTLLTFRKFYKFAVTNPLSVKTKVHTPKSPSAILSLDEREKLFLEVHIQNLTPAAMFFEKMRFECAEGWSVEDVNAGPMFEGSFASMQPQDTRQYIYILTPKTQNIALPSPPPGSIIPLGRLDLGWKSSYGEPGRLLTSMLTRRIPLPQVQQPVSAVPPYLKRTMAGQGPSRPNSPQIQSRPTSPITAGARPGSPAIQSRTQSITQIVQSPQAHSAALPASFAPPTPASDVEVNLIARHLPRNNLEVEKPFTARYALVVTRNPELGRRKLVFAVQHLKPQPKVAPVAVPAVIPVDATSPRSPLSGFSTPQSTSAVPFNYAVAHQKILDAAISKSPVSTIGEGGQAPAQTTLPPPYFENHDEGRPLSDGVTYAGASAIFLPPLTLPTGDEGTSGNPAVQEFQLTSIPSKRGFSTIGGLRILLVEDSHEADTEEQSWRVTRVQALREYDVIGEIWVGS
ncbi:hypothetical protein BKA70DRAFT_29403 [Coprinopsis sp. MPI-PUGE-AT-0042]|nr:hypothetical protein BKA70DRAFT_29403 [Coprinopsis sp. MPI-PUGE-AT-0042]